MAVPPAQVGRRRRRQVKDATSLVKQTEPVFSSPRAGIAAAAERSSCAGASYGESDKIATLLTRGLRQAHRHRQGGEELAPALRQLARAAGPGAGPLPPAARTPAWPSSRAASCSRSTVGAQRPGALRLRQLRRRARRPAHHRGRPGRRRSSPCSTRPWPSSSSGPATTAFLRGFELQLLTRAGFEPQLDRCTRCERPWADDEPRRRSASATGRSSCAACRSDEDATRRRSTPPCCRCSPS